MSVSSLMAPGEADVGVAGAVGVVGVAGGVGTVATPAETHASPLLFELHSGLYGAI